MKVRCLLGLAMIAAALMVVPQRVGALPPAASIFVTLRVTTTPAPLTPGLPGVITIETNGGLSVDDQFSVVRDDGVTPAMTITSYSIESETSAVFNVDVPLASTGTASLLVDIGSTKFGAGTVLVGTAEGTYHAINPTRVLDTRVGVGWSSALQDGAVASVPVVGVGDVPSQHVSALVATLTAVGPTGDGYLSAYASGIPVPEVSNLNFPAGSVVANQVIVKPGPDGRVSIFNYGGVTDVLLDVVGFYTTADGALGSTFGLNNGGTWRVLDTRATTKIAAHSTRRFVVPLTAGFGVRTAIIANVTVTRPEAPGYLSVFAAGLDRPNTSANNFTTGGSSAATTTIATDPSGAIDIYNGSDGAVDVIIDVLGAYYRQHPAVYRFQPAAVPFRAVDTRLPPIAQRIGAKTMFSTGVPTPRVPERASMLLGNITATGSTGTGFMNINHGGCCGDLAILSSSIINFSAGQTVANAFVSPIGPGGSLLVYNDAAPAHAIVDVFGWFVR